MSTPINIIIDNKTVLDDVDSCEIKRSEEQYCNSVSLSMKSKSFWALCDPVINFGELRVKVVIGATTYEFLIEERDTAPTKAGVAFTVWGRSKQALLSKPYSKTINDTDRTYHPWQEGETTAFGIVTHIVGRYCPYSVTVNWNVSNFTVFQNCFSVSNQAPIDVISALANVVGAELVAESDGSLSIETYSVDEGIAVEDYNDLDDIVQLSESIDYPSGYNAVTVYGYSSQDTSGQAYISVERVGSGDIYPGREHTVRVYYYHSKLYPLLCSFPEGVYQDKGGGVESITENVQLIFGVGHTSKPNYSDGSTIVAGNEFIPIKTVSKTYNVNYRDFTLKADETGEYTAMFYFSDKSASAIYSFTVVPSDGEGPFITSKDKCDSIVIEKASPDTITPGTVVYINVYGSEKPYNAYSSAGTPDFVIQSSDKKNEEVVFSNGEATLSYPIDTSLRHPVFKFFRMSPNVSYRNGVKQISVQPWVDNISYRSVPCTVTYYTSYYQYKITVPSLWTLSTFDVWFEFSYCEIKSISLTVSEVDSELDTRTRDITINVKDYATEITIEGATIYVDGSWKGATDAEGNITLKDIAVGDHTIKITKNGYLDSDLDDLANDTFTVSAE